jgi:predicted RNA methylase
MRINKFRQINQNLSRGEVFTHPKLVVKILLKIPESIYLNKESIFLIPGCGMGVFMIELVKILVEKYGYTVEDAKSRVIGVDNRIKYINYLKRKGYRVYHLDFLKDDLPMKKFDVCIMNPPYTQGAKPLYSHFTQKAFEYTNLVVSVMPIDLNSNHDKLKKLNELINKHQIYISDNVSDYFNVGVPNIHYTILDKSINNPILQKKNPLDELEILYSERNRIKFIAGNTECGETEEDENGINVVYKLLQGDNLVIKKIPKEKVEKSKNWTNSKYSVFVNVTPSNGKFNCAILKNCKMTWTRKVFMVECDSLESANKMKNWLQSDEIQSEVSKMLKAKNNTYSVSLEMVNRLPYYE